MKTKKGIITREDQDTVVELWQESGITQVAFCKQEGIGYNTFIGWMKRYRKIKGLNRKAIQKSPNCFLDVEVSPPSTSLDNLNHTESITIRYPNGVELSCSLPLALSQNLLTLLD